MQVVVERSRVKMLLSILGSALFVVASLAILSQGTALALLVGATGLVTFSGFGVGWIVLCLRAGPGLVVDDTGFDDQSSAVAVGRVMWSDVTSLSAWGAFGTSHVVVRVRNPEMYLPRLGWFARLAAAANHRLVGSPVVIASGGLRTDFESLSVLLNDAFEQYHLGLSDR